MAGNIDLANETAKRKAEQEQAKAAEKARKEQEKADKKKAKQEKAAAKAKEKELSGKTRNPLQELSHEFKKNVLGTEGFDKQDEQQEYNKYFKMKPEERQKLIDSGKVTGQKLDVLKQAHADAETGEKKKVEKQVINASTGEKMDLDESKKITEEKAKTEEKPANYAPAKATPVTDTTEKAIAEKADTLAEDLENKNSEYANRMSKRVAEFEKDVDDKYIEGLPKGLWRQYKSDAYGLSTESALKKLQSMGLSEEEAKKALKNPQTEEQKKIADANKDAKSTLGYFVLDAVANGLSNMSKAVRGQDIDTNAGAAKQMNQTNLEKALERRNQKYGTLQERQWQSLIDSAGLTNEQRKALGDIKVSSAFTKQLNKLDNETKKQALDLMAKWKFAPKQIADLVAAREVVKEDPDAKDIVMSQLASKGIDIAENKGVLSFLGF